MTTKKFYISDWHYGHANCISFDNRPFLDVKSMNEMLISNWNNAVSPGDVVYVLGDMFWCKQEEAMPVLDQLNGTKILIKGNHDRCNDGAFLKKFAKVAEYMEVKDADRHVVLCHYPIVCFKNHYHGWYHLYGHVHNSFEYHVMEQNRRLMHDLYEKPCNMFNVGVMMPYMDYTPRTLDEILEWNEVHTIESNP